MVNALVHLCQKIHDERVVLYIQRYLISSRVDMVLFFYTFYCRLGYINTLQLSNYFLPSHFQCINLKSKLEIGLFIYENSVLRRPLALCLPEYYFGTVLKLVEVSLLSTTNVANVSD